MEKRRAIESEDYDRAKVKKQQMEEYRRLAYENLRISNLLDSSMVWQYWILLYNVTAYLVMDLSVILLGGMLDLIIIFYCPTRQSKLLYNHKVIIDRVGFDSLTKTLCF